MKYIFVILMFITPKAKADLWGGDLPLLAQIVTNTLHTMYELQRQSQLMNDQMRGINDRINRIKTIADIVQPSQWDQWKDPKEAINRLRMIYHTLPKEYHSEKADMIEQELAKAMNLVSRVSTDSETTFKSGKQIERLGLESSPGVAEKLTASGIGTMISMEAQSQVIQSHIVSLLAQMLAEGHERESRMVVSNGLNYAGVSGSLKSEKSTFSSIVFKTRSEP